MPKFRVVSSGLCYPTDPVVDEALRAFGREATAAALQAGNTHDPRDIDAAATAERARQQAVAQALASGSLVEREVGAIVDDIPEGSIGWLVEQGHIQTVIDEAPVAASKRRRDKAPIEPAETPEKESL